MREQQREQQLALRLLMEENKRLVDEAATLRGGSAPLRLDSSGDLARRPEADARKAEPLLPEGGMFERGVLSQHASAPEAAEGVPWVAFECLRLLEPRATAEDMASTADSKQLQTLIVNAFDRRKPEAARAAIDNAGVVAAAGLLRHYLCSLSTPVIPHGQYFQWMEMADRAAEIIAQATTSADGGGGGGNKMSKSRKASDLGEEHLSQPSPRLKAGRKGSLATFLPMSGKPMAPKLKDVDPAAEAAELAAAVKWARHEMLMAARALLQSMPAVNRVLLAHVLRLLATSLSRPSRSNDRDAPSKPGVEVLAMVWSSALFQCPEQHVSPFMLLADRKCAAMCTALLIEERSSLLAGVTLLRVKSASQVRPLHSGDSSPSSSVSSMSQVSSLALTAADHLTKSPESGRVSWSTPSSPVSSHFSSSSSTLRELDVEKATNRMLRSLAVGSEGSIGGFVVREGYCKKRARRQRNRLQQRFFQLVQYGPVFRLLYYKKRSDVGISQPQGIIPCACITAVRVPKKFDAHLLRIHCSPPVEDYEIQLERSGDCLR